MSMVFTRFTNARDIRKACLLFLTVVVMVPILSAAQDTTTNPATSTLVLHVRQATQQFKDVNAATSANYTPLFGCVSGPDHGAMGVHYINIGYVTDGQIEVTHPEALIYEPSNGSMRLVGVEYIVDAATWLADHNNQPPILDGQLFDYEAAPNRYGLPAFFALHVWAWRNNPQGTFAEWNNRVSCDGE